MPQLRRRRKLHRADAIQAHVRDADGSQHRRLHDNAPPTRDRTGDLRQLPERPRHHPRKNPLRHRPDRKELPKRGYDQGLHLREPGTDDEWYEHWKQARFNWYLDLGIKKDNLRFREHDPDELAHYAKGCVDVEYKFPFGSGDWQELEGVANRTDMRTLNKWYESDGDIGKIELADEAEEYLKGPLSYFDDQQKKRYIPYVIEPSAGIDRSALAFLVDAYDEEEVRGETRNLLRFHPALAPVKVAVFPLVKKDGMPEIAMNICKDLKRYFNAFYDQKGAIGRRYRRQDEAGTPYCITIDGQTLEDKTVTLRDRDSMEQTRIPTDNLLTQIREKLDI